MEVKFIEKNKGVKFHELGIGDAYWDMNGTLCIKTSESECIYYSEATGSWDSIAENVNELVEPAKATLTIE